MDTNIISSIEKAKGESPFFLLFRKEFIENKRKFLLQMGGICAVCILAGSLLGISGIGGGVNEILFFGLLIEIAVSIYTSLTFSEMKNKEGRISALMLPATVKDKFWMKWILTVPGMLIVSIAAFYLGDFARMLFAWAFDSKPLGSAYYTVINPFRWYSPGLSLLYWGALVSYFFSQACYLYGAILWPKLSFIKTFAALYVIEMICMVIGFLLVRMNLPFFESFTENDVLWVVRSLYILMGVMTVILYWLTYRRYRNEQVIYRLF